MNVSYVEIGERLRVRRKEMGLTQEWVAELLGISTTYYGEIERGNRRLSVQRVLDIHVSMGLDPTYLLTGKTSGSRLEDRFPAEKREAVERIVMEMAKLCKK